MKERTDGAIDLHSLRASRGHVPLHRLWALSKDRVELSTPQYDHVRACDECSFAFQVCRHAENFGVVLREIRREHEDPSNSDGKGKLKTLYILQRPISPKNG
jgi:hypothetical protein